jgi:hypothetical protein
MCRKVKKIHFQNKTRKHFTENIQLQTVKGHYITALQIHLNLINFHWFEHLTKTFLREIFGGEFSLRNGGKYILPSLGNGAEFRPQICLKKTLERIWEWSMQERLPQWQILRKFGHTVLDLKLFKAFPILSPWKTRERYECTLYFYYWCLNLKIKRQQLEGVPRPFSNIKQVAC